MIDSKKIGYIKTESFWKMLKAFGLEMSVKTGGYLQENYEKYEISRMNTLDNCQMTDDHEYPILFISPEIYCKTIQRVEDKLKYQLFGK